MTGPVGLIRQHSHNLAIQFIYLLFSEISSLRRAKGVTPQLNFCAAFLLELHDAGCDEYQQLIF